MLVWCKERRETSTAVMFVWLFAVSVVFNENDPLNLNNAYSMDADIPAWISSVL